MTGDTGAHAVEGMSTVAYDAASGAQLWVGNGPVDGNAVSTSPDGSRVFVAGSGPDYLTTAFAAPPESRSGASNTAGMGV